MFVIQNDFMKNLSIRLPEETRKKIDQIADEQGLKPTQIMRSVLIKFARSQDSDPKQQEAA